MGPDEDARVALVELLEGGAVVFTDDAEGRIVGPVEDARVALIKVFVGGAVIPLCANGDKVVFAALTKYV